MYSYSISYHLIKALFPGIFSKARSQIRYLLTGAGLSEIVGIAHFVMDFCDYWDAASPSKQP
jgi:hypothetical protein